ncbi:hypothetical protein Tco_0374033 [Tanacetum coccineum]
MFVATTPENTPPAYGASTLTNPNPVISPAFMEANYETLDENYDEEREMEPRPEPARVVTPPLRSASPMVHRRKKRVEGFEETKNMRGKQRQKEQRRWKAFGRSIRREWKSKCKPSSTFSSPHREKREWATFTVFPDFRLRSQKAGSILDYEDIKSKFRSHFSQQKKFTKTHLDVHNIKHRENERTRAFMTRYTDDTLQILGLHEDQRISGFIHGLRTRSLVKRLSTDLPTTYKGLMEKTYTWVKAREVATNGISSDQRESFERLKKSSWDNNRGQKNKDMFSPYRGPNHGLLFNLSKSPIEILAIERAVKRFKPPPKTFGSKRPGDTSKYCHFHEDYRHNTNDF